MNQSYKHPNQKGAALLVALIVLTMITFIGAASLKQSVMQSRIVTNTNASGIAFQAADSAIESILAEVATGKSPEGQPPVMTVVRTTTEVRRCVNGGLPPDACTPLKGPGQVRANGLIKLSDTPERAVTGNSTDTVVWRFYDVRGRGTVGTNRLSQVTHEQEIARRELAASDGVYEKPMEFTGAEL